MSITIAYVINDATFFLTHRLTLAQQARRSGYKVHVLTPMGDGVQGIIDHGFEWHEIAFVRSSNNPIRDAFATLHLARLYRRLQLQLVHHVTIKPVVFGTFAARLAHVPAVVNAVTGMGYLFTDNRRLLRLLGEGLYRALVRHPNMIVIVQNEDDRHLMTTWLPNATVQRIPGSGVDVDSFAPTGVHDGVPTVVHVSRMLADKGVREYIEAARIVRTTQPDVRFVLVGDTDEGNPTAIPETELRAAHEQGVIEWLGHRDDVSQILKSATVFCLPSYREGIPKSILEAFATGLATVTTNAPGCRDIVKHEQNGLLVPLKNPEALAAAVARLLADPALRSELGKNARRDAEDIYALSHIIGQTLCLYPFLLNGRIAAE